jgi:hypothetical protein
MMTLVAGTKLGPYEIVALIGAGGMGEVYRARDTKLNREVALKILPATFANDAQRMARFQREAQVLASLNHPNIASIYGLEESGGVRALVMELVEGPTLAERVAQGPIPLDEALPIAKQITEALEAAHEKGIIHRDLKPANVKITPQGVVKVLDFGLAKAVEGEGAGGQVFGAGLTQSPTLTGMATQAGIILGTAAYMSPEQARGKPVDRRADIWAFGVVLYEMLTGKPAFEGETTSDMLAAVIKTEPNWDLLPAGIPVSIRKLVRRCLEKDPRLRLCDIGDARIEIGDALAAPAGSLASTAVPESAPAATKTRLMPWSAVMVLGLVLICLAVPLGMWLERRRATPPPRWSGDLLGGSDVALGPRISPDGHTVAFLAMVDNLTQVAVLNVDSGNWAVRTQDRSHGIVGEIAWSRDGSKLYFDRLAEPEGIYTVPSLGGDERLVLENAQYPEVLRDGSLLVSRVDPDRRLQIYHYWPDTGQLQALGAWTETPSGTSWVRVFPDGNEAVFFGTTSGKGSDGLPHLYALDVTSGRARQLAPQLPIRQTYLSFPLAVTPDNRSVLIDLPSGNLHQIVAVPRSGSGPVEMLMTLTTAPWLMDAAPDGTVYLDQVERPLEVLRFLVTGGTPEVVASSETYPVGQVWQQPVELPDGRFLLPSLLSGRARLLIGKPGRNFSPLVDTAEETGPLATLLPNNEVAFMAGTGSDQTIVIASVSQSRISRRLHGVNGAYLTGLAASADGRTLFYTTSKNVWAIPAADGPPRKICAGDGFAVDPNGQDLIVNLNEQAGVHLVRVPISGGPGHDIRVQNDPPIGPIPLGGNGVRKDGKILVGVAPRDSWFFTLAILDPATGKLTRVPVNYTGDLFPSAWGSDGRILATGALMRAQLWRFRPMR